MTTSATISSQAFVGDFNGDGHLDVAVSGNANNIYVFLGNGDGTLQSPLVTAIGVPFGIVSTGDFNGDGIADIAILEPGGPISVLPGNGDGTFQPPISVISAGSPSAVQAADLNGDGRPDFVFYSSSGLVESLNDGNGTFQTPVVISSDSSLYGSIAITDITGDGFPDVVTLGTTGAVIFPGKGDGTFGGPLTPGVIILPPSSALFGGSSGEIPSSGVTLVIAGNVIDLWFESSYIDYGEGGYVPINVFCQIQGGTGLTSSSNGSCNSTDTNAPQSIVVSTATGNFEGFGPYDIASVTKTNVFNQTTGGEDTTFAFGIQSTAFWPAATASFTGTSLPGPAPQTIVSSYSGDTNYAPGTSNSLILYAQPSPSINVVSYPGQSEPYGTSVTFSVIVSGTTLPSGTVQFFNGSTALSSALPLIGSPGDTSTANYTTSTLAPGNYSISVKYSGDTNYAPETSGGLSYQVTAAKLSFISSGVTTPYGSPVTVTAQLGVAGEQPAPTGQVTLSGQGGAPLGSQTFTISGAPPFQLSAALNTAGQHLVPGRYAFVWSYTGDAYWAPALTESVLTVQGTDSLSLSYSGPATVTAGGTPVTFSGTLSEPYSSYTNTPSGTVSLLQNGNVIATTSLSVAPPFSF